METMVSFGLMFLNNGGSVTQSPLSISIIFYLGESVIEYIRFLIDVCGNHSHSVDWRMHPCINVSLTHLKSSLNVLWGNCLDIRVSGRAFPLLAYAKWS